MQVFRVDFRSTIANDTLVLLANILLGSPDLAFRNVSPIHLLVYDYRLH